MNKYLMFAVLINFVLSSYAVDSFAAFKSTKFTVVVVSEEEKPIAGVKVGVGFERNTGSGTDSSGQQGITDLDGKLTFAGESNGHITYSGSKYGYYPSYYDYDFETLSTFGWKPWNPEFKLVMRKIEKPVPMYARQAALKIPVIGKDVGFDLIEFDWVRPYGKGINSDFIFHLENKILDRENFVARLSIKFSNNFDGLLKVEDNFRNGSVFKLPRTAPLEGYGDMFSFERSQSSDGKRVRDYKRTDSYLFRIRSIKKDGEFVKAIYGKIHGPISFDPRLKSPEIYFTYYLNPDLTPNLEFDPKRNLFENLGDFQSVSEP
jgi:hypothetical protein